jgi:hypothetical protein
MFPETYRRDDESRRNPGKQQIRRYLADNIARAFLSMKFIETLEEAHPAVQYEVA